MSSHREAPEISKDPVADSTDLYAFVSPDKPNTVTILANYIPLQDPAGGPNFFEFGDDVLYEIDIDTNGDGVANISYQFNFTTVVENPNTFLYNTGPINSLTDKNWNRRQYYSVTKVVNGQPTVLGSNIPCPPCRIGPYSTPNYQPLAKAAITTLQTGEVVFAGQRVEGFYIDLGSVFDLLDLRPFQSLHLMPKANQPGVDGTRSLNVHSIAMQIPISMLNQNGSVIGIWTAAYRQQGMVRSGAQKKRINAGPWMQVSRLGNPLFNEVIVPMGQKDTWNQQAPSGDSAYAQLVAHPEVAGLLPVLYPNVFPNLQGLNQQNVSRADLVAILLTGIPAGLIQGFQNYTGSTQADMLRLNMSIPPTKKPNRFGVIAGDLAGYPNGRRVIDDVFTIELRCIAGVTYPLIDNSYQPDPAASLVTDGVSPSEENTDFLTSFPYLGEPAGGYWFRTNTVP